MPKSSDDYITAHTKQIGLRGYVKCLSDAKPDVRSYTTCTRHTDTRTACARPARLVTLNTLLALLVEINGSPKDQSNDGGYLDKFIVEVMVVPIIMVGCSHNQGLSRWLMFMTWLFTQSP